MEAVAACWFTATATGITGAPHSSPCRLLWAPLRLGQGQRPHPTAPWSPDFLGGVRPRRSPARLLTRGKPKLKASACGHVA